VIVVTKDGLSVAIVGRRLRRKRVDLTGEFGQAISQGSMTTSSQPATSRTRHQAVADHAFYRGPFGGRELLGKLLESGVVDHDAHCGSPETPIYPDQFVKLNQATVFVVFVEFSKYFWV
jgi:hypothetical protein